MNLFLVNIFLALAWGAVSGSFSILNLVFGFVLGAFALVLIREQISPEDGYGRRVVRTTRLAVFFLKELILSAWNVAVLVASPKMDAKPGIFAFPLTVERDIEITLLANMITLTPGTLSVDVSDDRKLIYVHAIDCSDPEAARRDIRDGFEKKILEAFE